MDAKICIVKNEFGRNWVFMRRNYVWFPGGLLETNFCKNETTDAGLWCRQLLEYFVCDYSVRVLTLQARAWQWLAAVAVWWLCFSASLIVCSFMLIGYVWFSFIYATNISMSILYASMYELYYVRRRRKRRRRSIVSVELCVQRAVLCGCCHDDRWWLHNKIIILLELLSCSYSLGEDAVVLLIIDGNREASKSKGPSIYDVHKKSRFWPPLPLWTSTHGRHEIHTALLKWLVQWPTGPKAEIRLYDYNLFKLYC